MKFKLYILIFFLILLINFVFFFKRMNEIDPIMSDILVGKNQIIINDFIAAILLRKVNKIF